MQLAETSSLYFSTPPVPLCHRSETGSFPLGEQKIKERLMGEEDEALYDRGVDRFREPGDFSKAAGSNAEALGHWLQGVRGSSGSMAKNSQHGSAGGQLSASCGALSNHRGNLIRTVTNQFGEFRGEIENSGDLELSFPGKGEKSIVISLRNAL